MNEVNVSHEDFLKITKDYSLTAEVAKLVYVSDKEQGIIRIKKGKGFSYLFKDGVLKDKKHLDRIKKLVLPPAWKNVWICYYENGHIQATGYDTKNRKQYRYHTLWNVLRNETKFHRLYEFGKAIPQLRLRVEEDMQIKDLSERKVLATVISLMERTYIRVGNAEYEKANGSFGLTTLKDKHVRIEGGKITFAFKGKRGILHNITLQNKKLAKAVKDCRDIPGKELFQYYTEKGERRSIDSSLLNSYIKEITKGDFSAKDFRTWAGTLHMLRSLHVLEKAETATQRKSNIVSALNEVSIKLGNTRTVCKKYYVHPGIIDLYEKDEINKYLKELDGIEEPDDKTGLTKDEKILMKILKQFILSSSKPSV
ncbi:MAG: DNA topoisomerase IB [Parafilimonas sp.]|nr:DNA topoisomerase IB [Parafilimonas sp.]